MKAIFVLALVCLFSSVYGDNYYFSSVSGNDSRTISEAQNPATPWKTLDKLNAFFPSLKPGDAVYLKRGETYNGSIIVKQSGSATSPIFIGAYGSGNKPIISSLSTLTGWVSKGGGIWESSSNSFLGPVVNVVLMNGAEQEMGRYPNSDASNNGYLNFESHVGKTSITDNELSTATNWKGAQLVLRSRHWVLDRSLITSQSGHKISYSTSSPYEPYENYGYFIQNSVKTLDKVGEWYYNPSTKKISVYFGSKGPSSFTVQASATSNDLVSSAKYSNVVFDNLSIKGSNNAGFHITDGADIHIQNCDILFSGTTGIVAGGTSNFHIENCTISNSNNNGIDFEYGVNNAVVKNNQILNTATIPGMLQNGEGAGLAIYTNGDGNNIESNVIRKTGFIGITFYGNNVTIKNNLIDSFCFVKDDGGGIYTHGATTRTVNKKLIGNIIMDGVGAGKGTDNPDKRAVTGIYMDANTTDVEIRDNTVTTCFQGILLQSTTRITVKSNTVFNNVRQLAMVGDKDNNPVRYSTISQNIFFSKSPVQWPLYIMSSADDIKSFGKFDSNYYARPLDDRMTIYTNYVGPKGSVTETFDLDGWKTAYGQDKHSKKTAKQIEPFKITGMVGSNKFVNGGDFSSNVKGVSASSCTISPASSGQLDGGYLQVVPASRGAALYIKVGQVTAGKNYLLSYSAKGSVENDMSLGACLKQINFPYTAITQVQSRKINKIRTENQMIFSPSDTKVATLELKSDDQSKYYLDNIRFYEVNAKVTDPDDSIRFVYNATRTTKSVTLNGSYVDTRGKIYSNSIALQPYTSAILIKTRAEAPKTAPAVAINIPSTKPVLTLSSSIIITAAATDADGSISKVEFYNGSTLLKTEYKAPYDCTLDSLEAGRYSITAKATDNDGLTTTSSPIVFSVSASNAAPVVNISIPVVSGLKAPATIEIAAIATDADGSISKVEFYNGSALLATEYKFPYTYTWKNVPAGNYTITAKATDNNGLSTTSARTSVSVKSQPASRSTSAGVAGVISGVSPIVSDTSLYNTGMESMPVNNDIFNNGKKPNQQDITKLSAFRLGPNPAVSIIQISFEGLVINEKAILTVRTTSGAMVKKYPVIITGRKIDVDISSLIPGIYIIGLSGDNFTVNKRFLKIAQ